MASRLIFNDRQRVGEWVSPSGDPLTHYGQFYAMGAERDGELVAGIVMDHYNGSNAMAHIRIAKPGKDTFTLLQAFFDYVFCQLKLKRLSGFVPSIWPKALAFFVKKLGFEVEHVIKDGFPEGDMVLLVMRPEHCRWLVQKETRDATP